MADHLIYSDPIYTPVNYGYKKFGDLIRATELFDIEMRDDTVMYIKDARK